MKIFISAFMALVILTVVQIKAQPETWQHQIAFDAGIQMPGGNVSDYFNLKTGIGVSASYYYQLKDMPNYFLSGTLGYQEFESDWYNNHDNFSNLLLSAGMKYNFVLTGLQPYIGGEITYNMSTYPSSQSYNNTSNNLGILLKGGLRYPIAYHFDLDANLKYNTIFDDPKMSILGLNIGVAYTI